MSSFDSNATFSTQRAWSASATSGLGASEYATTRTPVSPKYRLACEWTGGSRRGGKSGSARQASTVRRAPDLGVAAAPERVEPPQGAGRARVQRRQRQPRAAAVPFLDRGPERPRVERLLRTCDDRADPGPYVGLAPPLVRERLERLGCEKQR
jgi:hypothetical protein